jgi:hypothetical protein
MFKSQAVERNTAMSTPNSLVGRSSFAQAIAEITPLVARLAQEAMANRNWSNFGHKAIEIVAGWEVSNRLRHLRRNWRMGRAIPNGWIDWQERRREFDLVKKPSKKIGGEKNWLKWVHVKHGGGMEGAYLLDRGLGEEFDADGDCSPLRMKMRRKICRLCESRNRLWWRLRTATTL